MQQLQTIKMVGMFLCIGCAVVDAICGQAGEWSDQPVVTIRSVDVSLDDIPRLPQDMSPTERSFIAYDHGMRAALLMGDGKLDDALDQYRRALALDKTDVLFYSGIANIFDMQNKWDQALEILREGIKNSAEPSTLWRDLGVLLEKYGRQADAFDAFSKSYALAPSAEICAQIGSIRLRQHQDFIAPSGSMSTIREHYIADAVMWLERALSHDENCGNALINLGYIYNLQGRPEDAISVLSHAIALQPSSATAHLNMGCAFLQLGLYAESERALRTVLLYAPTSRDAYLNLVCVYAEQRQAGKLWALFTEMKVNRVI